MHPATLTARTARTGLFALVLSALAACGDPPAFVGPDYPTRAAAKQDVAPSAPVLVASLPSAVGNTQGSGVGPGGALFVTDPYGGRVLRVDPQTGAVTPFASGLPTGFGGAADVAFIGQTAYVLVTLVGPDVGGNDIVGVYRVDGPTSFTIIADIGAFAQANPPETEFFVPTGVQFAIEPFRGGFLVTDGHHNRVLRVTLDGEVSELIALGNVVPTGLTVAGNTIYMAEAGPLPHLPADGRVVAFTPESTSPAVVAAGARLAVDVERGRGRTLFALSMGVWAGTVEGDPPQPNTGALVRVNADGTFTTVVGGLDRPTTFEIIDNSAYIVMLDGEVWRIDDIAGPPFRAADR